MPLTTNAEMKVISDGWARGIEILNAIRAKLIELSNGYRFTILKTDNLLGEFFLYFSGFNIYVRLKFVRRIANEIPRYDEGFLEWGLVNRDGTQEDPDVVLRYDLEGFLFDRKEDGTFYQASQEQRNLLRGEFANTILLEYIYSVVKHRIASDPTD